MKRVAILGGGITGLVAAFELERLTDAEIDLYEASPRPGGKVGTIRLGDMTVETGPDCFFARKAGVSELVTELGLESELIEPKQKGFQMLVGGKLYDVPPELVTLNSASLHAIDEAAFLSPAVKARAQAECQQPPSTAPDESIKAFFTRRFGAEFSRLVVEPLLGGTHGGDASELSMRALYPGYWSMEQNHGSLSGAPSGTAVPGSAFKSFKGGMQVLIDHLTARLSRTRIHLGESRTLSELNADATLVALPANHAAAAIESKLPEAARLMRTIDHASSSIVTLVFDRTQISDPLDSTGFLVPHGELEVVTGATFSSEKWPNRAPEGTVLMRVFLGGDRDALATRPTNELVEVAVETIRPLLGITGAPRVSRVDRWIEALPQYVLGHLEKVATIETELSKLPGLYVAGTSYGGVGLPDSSRQAKEVAIRIAEEL